MRCQDATALALPFQLGALDEPERAPFEQHLQTCPTCLRDYLLLKRTVDFGSAVEQRPSEAVRARLRRDVAALHARPRQKFGLFVGLAAAVVLIAVLGLRFSAPKTAPLTPPPGVNAHTLIDSSPVSVDQL